MGEEVEEQYKHLRLMVGSENTAFECNSSEVLLQSTVGDGRKGRRGLTSAGPARLC